jgi:hypothetical protein
MSFRPMSFEMRTHCLALVQLSLVFSVAAAAQMPYNPTRILVNDDFLYVFRPSSQSSTQFELSSLYVGSRVDAANLDYGALYPTLPFLHDDAPRAFTPVLDNGGNLTVYTGDCALGASGGEVWSYTPDPTQDRSKGSWTKEDVSVGDSEHASIMGANYLNGGMAFSSIVGGEAAMTGAYFFGGMCPNETNPTDGWQSAANYSNLMVTLQPPGHEPVKYNLDVSSSRGPPVPEAGFTMTGLLPTFSNRSDGTQTQQQNFVLVGGHTSAAFINMSQIALFSLPEQGWTFIGVDQPDTSTTDVTTVDPRSGHTAVLSPDGQQIIVFGGWVGDVDTPAEPQYAVLNIADGYGGDGDWRWTVPSTNGAGLPDNAGLYGHGAAMLPGGVLMITGGYSIPSPSSRQRRDTPTVNTKAYFLNVTSNTWTTDYTPPIQEADSETTHTGPLSSTAQKAGLGVGIGIGLAAVIALFTFYMWYTRRLKRKREIREKQLHDLSYTTHRYNLETYSPGFDGRGGHSDSLDDLDQNGPYIFPSGTQGGQGWKAANRGDAERTGLLVEIPSPTRGLRRGLSNKPAYAMGRARGPGTIHPIDELEEEPEEEHTHDRTPLTVRTDMVERRSVQGASILDNAPVLDPFIDSHRHDHDQKIALYSVPTSHARQSSGQTENGALGRSSPSLTGRFSPDKSTSDRTGSNLSERSTLSWTSSDIGVIRSASMRSGALLNTNPFKSPDASPPHDRLGKNTDSGRYSPEDARRQSITSIRSNGPADADAFHTAQSSFAHLQAEGEVLLGGNPERPRPGTASSMSMMYRDTDTSNSRAATTTPTTSVALDTPIKTTQTPTRYRRRGSWLGSVRRVLTRSASSAERTRSLTTHPISYPDEPYTDNPTEPPSQPLEPENARKSFPAATAPPRRAASDASFWRNRRGQADWLEDEQDPTWRRNAGDDWGTPEDFILAERERKRREWRERGKNLLVHLPPDDEQLDLPTPNTPIHPDHLGVVGKEAGRPGTPASEKDWDVEAAVERRVVQVMFTVPKSKLRVVNADADADADGNSMLDGDEEPRHLDEQSGRVSDLKGRFEALSTNTETGMGSGSGSAGPSRISPRPSPSSSVRSAKVRGRQDLRRESSVRSARRVVGAADGE